MSDALELVLSKFPDAKKENDHYRAHCPLHDGERPALTIKQGDKAVVLHCHAECNSMKILEAVGLKPSDLFPKPTQRKEVAAYDYTDEDGNLLFQAVRYEPKDFRQRRPDENGRWVWSLGDTRRVLYRLPHIIANPDAWVFVVEGEKDADTLARAGYVATTNPMGAGKWGKADDSPLVGRHVCVIPDRDKAGRAHARDVIARLIGRAAEVRVIDLPGEGKDVSEWVARGGKLDTLVELIELPETLVLFSPPIRGEKQNNKGESEGISFPAFLIENETSSDTERPLNDDNETKRAASDQQNAENEPKQAVTFETVSLADLLAEPPESKSWVLDGLLPTSGTSLIAGKPKAGKSTVARCVAFGIANGREVLGRNGHVASRVLYLVHEDKRDDVREHFKNLGATTEPIDFYFGPAPHTAKEAVSALRDRLLETKPLLTVIDPLIRFLHLDDANDYAKVTKAMEPMGMLARECKTHIMMVHHAGKGEREGLDSILGSTAFFANVDTGILIKRNNKTGKRTIETDQRSGVALIPTVLIMNPATHEIDIHGGVMENEEYEVQKAILEYLPSDQGLPEKDIREAISGDHGVVAKVLRRLVRESKVLRSGAGRAGDPFLYQRNPALQGSTISDEEVKERMKEAGL